MKSPRQTLPRALLITGAYYPEFSAGGLQCQAVARVLRGVAHVRILTTATDRTLPAHDTVEGVAVSRVVVHFTTPWSQVWAAVRFTLELVRLLPKVDLVHIQGVSRKNIVVMALAKLWSRRVVLHLQTAKHDEPDTIKAQGRLAWWAYRSADLYLSVSPGLTERFLSADLPVGRIREIPNGVDTTRFSPAMAEERLELRIRLNLPPDRAVVLFVGVMSPDKQPHVLLEAWLRLQNDPAMASTLVFVGATDPTLFELAGRLIDQLRASVAASGFADRVRFVPPTSQIHEYFRAADVYVMPSLREGSPIALLEAMACGLACVASNLPGASDLIIETGVNGCLVPPGDTRALAAALAAVLVDPAAAARMGGAARRTVQDRFTMEVVGGKWLDAYRQVLAER